MPKFEGEIKNIISDGRTGFIRTGNGNEYYFNAKNILGDRRNLSPGKNAIFNLRKSFDNKEYKESEETYKYKTYKVMM